MIIIYYMWITLLGVDNMWIIVGMVLARQSCNMLQNQILVDIPKQGFILGGMLVKSALREPEVKAQAFDFRLIF